jgi:hypothetical protein
MRFTPSSTTFRYREGKKYSHGLRYVMPVVSVGICICIYSGFDAVYHIVLFFLHMSFGVVVSSFLPGATRSYLV